MPDVSLSLVIARDASLVASDRIGIPCLLVATLVTLTRNDNGYFVCAILCHCERSEAIKRIERPRRLIATRLVPLAMTDS